VAAGSALPSGTVTFLFTDIEGSTDLLKQLGRDRYESVLAEHSGIVRAAVAEHDGWVVDTQGDSLFCAFRSAREGVSAAVEAQRELESRGWPEHVRVRVRMGLHSGEPKAGDERYIGIGVHRAARIGAAAHGGQILVSETTRALVADDLPARVSLRSLGLHRLKDIDEPERLYQVVNPDLQELFPAVRTLRRRRSRRTRLALLAAVLAVAGGAAAGALLATGSASAKPVRLLANSIAVIDPKTGKPVGVVPLGFSPADVTADGDMIWVLNSSARTATSIDPSTLKVVQTVGLDGDPNSEYATGGTAWVGFRGGVDEIDSNGVTKFSLWKPTPNFGGGSGSSPCYSFVTGDGHSVWVAEGRHVAVLDASGGSVLDKLLLPGTTGSPPGSICYGLRYSDGVLLAIRGSDFSIGPVDLSTKSYTPVGRVVGLNTQSYGSANWAAGFGSYWVGTYTVNTKTAGQTNVLARVDPSSGQISSETVIAGGAGAFAVDPTSGLWALSDFSSNQGTLVHVDPKSDRITRTIRLRHTLCCPTIQDQIGLSVAVGHGRVWVALDSP
jgi:class 3 adenylate cyclase